MGVREGDWFPLPSGPCPSKQGRSISPCTEQPCLARGGRAHIPDAPQSCRWRRNRRPRSTIPSPCEGRAILRNDPSLVGCAEIDVDEPRGQGRLNRPAPIGPAKDLSRVEGHPRPAFGRSDRHRPPAHGGWRL